MKNSIRLNYRITFNSPFHFGTGLPRGLVDRGIARDGGGFLYIPGSTIKGILREHCEQLASSPTFSSIHLKSLQSPHIANLKPFAKTPTIIDRIFGSRFRESSLYFDNAVLQEEEAQMLGKEFFQDEKNAVRDRYLRTLQVEVRTQNRISRRLGTAVEKALFSSEYGLRSLAFQGEIAGVIDGVPIAGEDLSYSLVLFVAGLGLFERIGGNKSIGMGQFSFQVAGDCVRVNQQDYAVNDIIALLDYLELYDDALEEAS